MPRPKKDPTLIKGETLRIPVSAAEKNYIGEASAAEDGEFARWARAILLDAAKKVHESIATREEGRSNANTNSL